LGEGLSERIIILPLVLGTHKRTIIDQLRKHGSHAVRADASRQDGGDRLGKVSRQVLNTRLHVGDNVSLETRVLHLLGGGLTLRGVLLVEQFNLVLDEGNEVSIVLDSLNVQQSVEAVALGGLTINGSSHGINSFHIYFKGLPTLDYIYIIPQICGFVKRVFEIFFFLSLGDVFQLSTPLDCIHYTTLFSGCQEGIPTFFEEIFFILFA
jgi:hypothetical protein